ncbi:MAG: SUMF1/EgtB/PvdO family nonheme iron enzyme [Bacteroidetes bacterium]|nr:SUMF1/EgtB/PvdO family nonheme iron enzyme [Bacteroidota bacterium]
MVKNTWIAASAVALVIASCSKPSSRTTGQAYNNPKWGGFANQKYKGQETGPGLVLVEGGAFRMGATEKDLLYNNDNVERKVTVNSFYMDETEVSNIQYREYVYWLSRTFTDYPEVFMNALPDTLCWRSKLAYNEPFVEYYYRHPAYKDYPVVGVNWQQANDFAAWRTDRVNETILDKKKIVKYNVVADANNETNFNTRAYLSGQYEFSKKGKKPLKDYSKAKNKDQKRYKVAVEDGILLPDYRLPTEAEWEYAANANIGETQFDNIDQQKIYAWDDYTIRIKDGKEKNRGMIRANLIRSKGDMGGIAGGALNDAGFITTPVYSYWPNAYGLYNMAGNVSEWTLDVYRPLSLEDMDMFMPFRGNVYRTVLLDQYGAVEQKDSLGRLQYRDVTKEENANRRNYKEADNIGFKDEENYNDGEMTYEYGVTSMVNNKARVIKGGSWNDRQYWGIPGTRRFLDEKQSLSTLGFRCAMIRIGAPVGNSKKKYNRLPSSGIDKKTQRKSKKNATRS